MSSEDSPQKALNVEGTDFPEFYSRCCTSNLSVAQPIGEPRIDGMKAVLTRAALLWENGRTLTVGFVNPVPGTPRQQDKVKKVVKQWEAVANIKFQFVPNGKDAIIRVAFLSTDGSWSYAGKGALEFPRSKNTMNFSQVFDSDGITDWERGVILHEFGHAIGYLHEHQSPRRGEKLTLNEAVIIRQMKRLDETWTEQVTRHNILNIYSQPEVSSFSEVDFNSIMMYFMPREWNVQGITVDPTTDLSPLDKAFAFLNYPFIGGVSSSDPSANLVTALNTAGITGIYRQNIAAEYAEGDWQGVRAEFTRWAVNYRALAAKAAVVTEREAIAAAAPAAAVVGA